ncbi:hypothetical protein SIID45300_01073 [Candidatus Magnetaquicoccaceae bacterium FCR-1]|uniref:Uncharacterized protein n=2 Tax=Candidatus Magnetaquiglobus chichijimensis TaxID=3141448 RepID=A0ABQ0C7A3_9PROT
MRMKSRGEPTFPVEHRADALERDLSGLMFWGLIATSLMLIALLAIEIWSSHG